MDSNDGVEKADYRYATSLVSWSKFQYILVLTLKDQRVPTKCKAEGFGFMFRNMCVVNKL